MQIIASNSKFTIGSGFGKGKSFEIGDRVTEKFYERLDNKLKSRFTVMDAASKDRTLYSLEEQLLAIEIYLENVDSSGVIDQDTLFALFHAEFPERSYNSFIKLLYAIRARDTFVPQQGLTSIANDVAEALNSYDPERFPLSEDEITLGKLLRELRA